MAVVVGFRSDVISYELALRGVAWPFPAAAAESSAYERGNAIGLTSILDQGQLSSWLESCRRFCYLQRSSLAVADWARSGSMTRLLVSCKVQRIHRAVLAASKC